MPRFDYRLVDVFTTVRFGGNPLAVFPEADGIEPALMQRIAFELNLSETTFVLPSSAPGCDVRVRIFTPRSELPMAGHPTVGTAFVLGALAHGGRPRWVFEEGVGPVPVERVRRDGATLWRMTQPAPRFGPLAADAAAVATALGVAPGDVDPALPLEVVATGPPFLMVPLRSLDALGRARSPGDAWTASAERLGGAQPYLFVRSGERGARCRMFAPAHGIAEDPATGGAAGPLGAYLLAHGCVAPGADGVAHVTLTQGVEMGRPSTLHVEVEGSGRDVGAVRVAGACVPVGGGWIEP
ncbi:MAG: PhzF family phenazine biosynthesis protein [Proteobacteria bacterium]|nr:MAG: PhzF family phenazine biosynthesis protein [Pseudomonadota bacterium]